MTVRKLNLHSVFLKNHIGAFLLSKLRYLFSLKVIFEILIQKFFENLPNAQCKLTVEQLHYALAACLSEGSLLMLELAETCVATFPPQREKYYLGIREYIFMW